MSFSFQGGDARLQNEVMRVDRIHGALIGRLFFGGTLALEAIGLVGVRDLFAVLVRQSVKDVVHRSERVAKVEPLPPRLKIGNGLFPFALKLILFHVVPKRV